MTTVTSNDKKYVNSPQSPSGPPMDVDVSEHDDALLGIHETESAQTQHLLALSAWFMVRKTRLRTL